MKKKEIYSGEVTQYVDFPNKAKVKVFDAPEDDDNGTLMTVKNVIPGQKIRFRMKKKGVGDFTELLERSPFETTEECGLFRTCGGCVYQTLDYKKQLEIKEAGVVRLITKAITDDGNIPVFDETLPSPEIFKYRNKMEYSFGDAFKDGPLTLGLHKRGSRFDVLTTDECFLVHDDFNKILRVTLDFFKTEKIAYYHKMEGKGALRHLVMRRSAYSGEILITLVTTSDSSVSRKLLTEYVSVLKNTDIEGEIAGILHTLNDCVADVVKDEGTTLLYGRDHITEKILGLEFKITPFSFFQTNSHGAEVLYERARKYALSEEADQPESGVFPEEKSSVSKKRPVIFDLYSGTGTIAQIMAPVAEKVIGVEIVEEAVIAAKENAVLNGLDNCDFIAGDVLKVLNEIQEKPDFIIIDPPRDGVNPKALEKILDYGTKNILYISCKPTSLARDLVMCRQAGYEISRIGCVDMFPGTVHIETVCLLSKKKVK